MEKRNFIRNFLFFLVSGLLLFSCATPGVKVLDSRYKAEVLVPESHFHGIHGLTFDSKDNLYAGSVVGQAVYQVNTKTGAVKEIIGPPEGLADDLEFGPDGKLYYTSHIVGKLRCMDKSGKISVLAEGLPGINSLAFDKDGRLFATEVFYGDALYEIDLSGKKETKKIAEKLGGLNGFDFSPDNKLYGPIWFKGIIARVDVKTGDMETIASGFNIPSAVNFDSKGNLYATDTATGEVVQVDIKTGQKKVIAKVDPSIDNLAIDSKDRIFISNMSDNSIYEIDKVTGAARTVVKGRLACAGGIGVVSGPDGDTLYLADIFSYKKANGNTGEITTLKRAHAADSQIEYPMTVSVHKDNTILTSWSTNTVQVIDTNTNQSKKILHGFSYSSHALMMDDGSLIIAEMGTGNLLKVTGAEGKTREVVTEGLVLPVYLAKDGENAVYLTEAGSGIVSRIDLKTGEKKVVAKELKLPEGIGVLPDGKLVVVESGTKQLLKIDPETGTITPIVHILSIGYPAIPGMFPFGMITGVAVSKAGTIYVAGDINNALYKITSK